MRSPSASAPSEIFTTLGDTTLQGTACYRLGLACTLSGRYAQAMGYLQQGQAQFQDDVLRRALLSVALPGVSFLCWLAVCHAEQGEFAAAIALGTEAVRLAETAEHPFTLVEVSWGLSRAQTLRGQPEAAVPVLERAVEVCEGWQIPIWINVVTAGLGYAYVLAGRIDEGLALLEQIARREKPLFQEALRFSQLGEAYLLAGRGADARRAAERAHALAQARQERGYEAWTLRLLGEIAAQAAPPETEQAESYYRQSLALAEELGMRSLVAHCHLGCGTLYRQVGRPEQAQAELATAAEMYRAMEMPFWLARAEAEFAAPR
jgi:tetratricopeptide (TPR) repeat protein